MLLRIEDIDTARSNLEWEAAIYDDMAWLEVNYPRPVMRQSERLQNYRAALTRLDSLGVIYPCSCSRGHIRSTLSAPQEGAWETGNGIVYPGTCRGRAMSSEGQADAIRLDTGRAMELTGRLAFTETAPKMAGVYNFDATFMRNRVGDIVLARRDLGTSYHLSVVIDDAEQNVTEVVRGEDIFDATPIHLLLQRLLGLPTPIYYHHPLIRDEAGKRLAKRDNARALAKYRAEGATPADIYRMVGL